LVRGAGWEKLVLRALVGRACSRAR
jgi:hypothetical protein